MGPKRPWSSRLDGAPTSSPFLSKVAEASSRVVENNPFCRLLGLISLLDILGARAIHRKTLTFHFPALSNLHPPYWHRKNLVYRLLQICIPNTRGPQMPRVHNEGEARKHKFRYEMRNALSPGGVVKVLCPCPLGDRPKSANTACFKTSNANSGYPR